MLKSTKIGNYLSRHMCNNKKFQDIVINLNRLNHLTNLSCVSRSFQVLLQQKNIIYRLFVVKSFVELFVE